MTPPRWNSAVIVGASSGIGAETARQLALRGTTVALVSRRSTVLQALADEIAQAGGSAIVYEHDVTRVAEAAPLLERIAQDLRGVDLVVYSAGLMERVTPTDYDAGRDCAMVAVNLEGAIAWLDAAAVRFAAMGGGTIVAVSSVAGDRGRYLQPAYCASKAGLDAFVEGLRNRLSRLGVRVVTVKPGPVATAMTAGLTGLPFMTDAATVGRSLIRAAAGGPLVAYVPWFWRPIMAVVRNIPSFLFRRLSV